MRVFRHERGGRNVIFSAIIKEPICLRGSDKVKDHMQSKPVKYNRHRTNTLDHSASPTLKNKSTSSLSSSVLLQEAGGLRVIVWASLNEPTCL